MKEIRGAVYVASIRNKQRGTRIHSVYSSGPGEARRQACSWCRINGIPLESVNIDVRQTFQK